MPAVLKEPILKCIAFAQGCIFSDPLKICCTYDMASIWEVHVFHLVLEQCILKYWSYINHIPYDYTMEVRNRFKGLDLIDRVPDELWTEVRDIVQVTGIKTIPMEKKCKKAKWPSGEAL